MLENQDKIKLLSISLFFDFIMLNILVGCVLTRIDYYWILWNLNIHALFMIGIIWNQKSILAVLHYFVFLNPFLSFWVNHISIKVLSLLFIILIQFMWVKENRCLMNEKEESKNFGFGKSLNYAVIVFNSILGINVGLALRPILNF